MTQWMRTGFAALLVGACATPAPPPSSQHLDPAPVVAGKVPDFAMLPPVPKPPKPSEKPELYSIVVHETPVQELLFAIARDAKLNISIHPAISGNVTMSVLDQTLTEVLDTINKQVDMRWELNGKMLSINQDLPFLKIYRIDYPNIARLGLSSVSISTNVASTGGGPGTSSGGGGNNASDSKVTNTANNEFWKTLVANVTEILVQTDRIQPAAQSGTAVAPVQVAAMAVAPVAAPATAASAPGGAAAPTPGAARPASGGTGGSPTAASPTGTSPTVAAQAAPAAPAVTAQPVAAAPAATMAATASGATAARSSYRDTGAGIANPENGVLNVRATQRQHEKVREFLDGIMSNARRQVLIEATIVEVDLSDRYQQGIDWSLLYRAGDAANSRGYIFTPAGPTTGMLTGGLLSSMGSFSYNRTINDTTLTSTLRLLESFGTLRVLSSPKVSVLNSQTSILKVVDNEVYFTVTVTPGTPATATSAATPATYTTTIGTVPVGFLMTVMPQISGHGEVILNLRPTISRITSYATDPNPALAAAGVVNKIPVVQTREMESILRVQSGDIAVLGGLIQDTRDRKTDAIPGLNTVPVVGDLFKYADNRSRKTELVIFLRPTVLSDTSLDGDFLKFRTMLPEAQGAFTQSGDRGKTSAMRP